MGKRLIIKGADFEVNAIERVAPPPTAQWLGNLTSSQGAGAAWAGGWFLFRTGTSNLGGKDPSFLYGKQIKKIRVWLRGSNNNSNSFQFGYFDANSNFVPLKTYFQSSLNYMAYDSPTPFADITQAFNELAVNETIPLTATGVALKFELPSQVNARMGLIVATGTYGTINPNYYGYTDGTTQRDWTPFVDFMYEP